MTSLLVRLLAPLGAACLLLAGASGAQAQTVLTMSSWVPPTHSLTRDVLVGVALPRVPMAAAAE